MIRTATGAAAIAAATAVYALFQTAPAAAAEKAPRVAGLIENAILYPGDIRLKAKLDTGARTSSLDVDSYRIFTRNGRDMVEFVVPRDDDGHVTVTRPLVRVSRVKERGGSDRTVMRPVVLMTVCIGDVARRTEVNLQDRSNFLYPLLVGRRFLIGAFVVDPGKRHLLTPDCPAAAKKAGR